MDAAIHQLRSAAQQLTRGKAPTGVRYPAAFRTRAVALAHRVRHPAGRGAVPLLLADDVPAAGRRRRSARAAQPASASGLIPKPELLATGPNQVWSWDITGWYPFGVESTT